ncbi:hypothetical protein, partial [Amaricoccus sp.]
MRKTLALLLVTTALTADVGVPVWRAMAAPGGAGERPVAAVFGEAQEALPLVLASDDDDNDREHRRVSRHGHDDDRDDDRDDDDDDDDDDDHGGRRGAREP